MSYLPTCSQRGPLARKPEARIQKRKTANRTPLPYLWFLTGASGFLVFLHNAGAVARHELGAERIGILPADRPDPSRILHPGAHVQVALLDEDRLGPASRGRIPQAPLPWRKPSQSRFPKAAPARPRCRLRRLASARTG